MKNFIFKVVLLSLPVILFLVFVNYFGDAAKIFDQDYEKKMVEIILDSSHATNMSNFDERIFQRELISRFTTTPGIVIIGSSRTMLINSDYFPDKVVFNHSVSGASLEDLISLYQIFKERKDLPDTIIIGIDPWIFNKKNGLKRWKSIKKYYNKFQNNDLSSSSNHSLVKYSELFSLSYFQSSIKEIPYKIFGNPNPIPTHEKYNYTHTKLFDGSLVYGFDYRNAPQREINSKITSFTKGGIYSIENFSSISEKKWNDFKLMIKDMGNNNIYVEFFLSPYAPQVYEIIEKEYSMVLKAEKIIKNYGKNENIKINGSFNPRILSMDSTYFYDGMHLKEKGISEIMNSHEEEP